MNDSKFTSDNLDDESRSRLFAKAMEENASLVAIFDGQSLDLLYLNKAGQDLLDPKGSLVGEDVSFRLVDFIGVSEIDRFDSTILQMLRLNGRWNGRFQMRNVWGSEFASLASISYSKSSLGETHICLQSTVISDELSSLKRESTDSEFLTVLLESATDSIYFKDDQSRFLRVSSSTAKGFGLDHPHEAIGKTDFDFFASEYASAAYEDEKRIIETGEPLIGREEKEVWKDGRMTWVSTTKMPLVDPEGAVIGTFGISRDITALKLVEKNRHATELRMQLAHKLESIGSLAAGLAHEINSPTQFVSDNVKFLENSFVQIEEVLEVYSKAKTLLKELDSENCEEQLKAMDTVEEDAELDYLREEIPLTFSQTLDGLNRVATIVTSLKEFSHQGSPEKAPSNLNGAIGTAINVCRHEWKYVAEVETELDPELIDVPCIMDEINQVMLNLIVNAAHAIEEANSGTDSEKGLISVSTRKSEDWAIIEVVDTGIGIPQKAQKHVFEPFYTTKRAGKGTGQGLALVQNIIVKNHDGVIEFDTEEGVGTTFRISLPLSAQSEHGGAN